MEEKEYQNLKYIILDRGVTSPVIFMLHGYGANAQDLAGLVNYIDVAGEYSWVFPEAPLKLPYPMQNARAWFPIDERAIQEAMMTGKPRDFRGQVVHEMPRLILQMESFINHIGGSREIILGGFSQGAMMSLHIHHRLGDKLKGMLLLSSAIVDETTLTYQSSNPCPAFVSHGRSDMVIGVSEGRYVSEQLSARHYKTDYVEFSGSHEIHFEVIERLKVFLKESLR